MAARAKHLAIVAVVAVVASTSLLGAVPAGAGTTADSVAKAVDWREFHGRSNHQGFNPAETVVGAGNVDSLGLSWIGNGATLGADLVSESSPAVVDGFAYFGTTGGQLLAFRDDCSTGQCYPAWRVDLGETITDSPAVVNGILYVGTSSYLGRLYAFDVAACAAGSCQPLWTAKVNVGSSSPTVSNGVVYVGSYDDDVYAFAAGGCGRATCAPLWVGHTDGYVLNSPAVAGGVVYAGDSTGYLYAFAANGCGPPSESPTAPVCSAMWRGRAANPILHASPAVYGGLVYTTSFGPDPDSFLEVFAAAGCGRAVCEPVWRGFGGHYLNSPPAVAYGSVYLGSSDGILRVYPAKGCGGSMCAASWIGYAAGSVATIESAPMVANGVVYVGENNATVRAFPAHGCGQPQCDKLWEFITQDPVVDSSPVLVNGTLYVSGTNFGSVPELYVFQLPGA